MRHFNIFAFFSFLAIAFFTATAANAALRIDITKGNAEPMPIALPNLPGGTVGADIIRVVSADLERSGLFRPISQSSFIEQITPQTVTPRFADWRQINAAALVTGSVTDSGNGKVKVAFRLWDVY